jgi:predicted enzyme related to lactoylglutathione lyase
MLPNNVINWFQIPSKDFDRAIKFYSTILGNPVNVREFQGTNMGFFSMAGGPDSRGVGGNLMPPEPENKPSMDGTTVFLACDGQIDAVIARVEPAGGKVLMPKFDMGKPGYMAIIKDTEGNKVGLHSYK